MHKVFLCYNLNVLNTYVDLYTFRVNGVILSA